MEWTSVEAHDPGFRGSPEYRRWRELLHHFYEPFPVVEHFAQVCVVADPLPQLGPVGRAQSARVCTGAAQSARLG